MAADLLILGFAAVGGAVALSAVANVLAFVYGHFLRQGHDLKRKFGPWALVTGATDGIGKAMAFEFARKGLNVVLVSRSKEKLAETEKELRAKYPAAQVETLDIDFSQFDLSARARVAKMVLGMDVGVLVNNVGISYPYTQVCGWRAESTHACKTRSPFVPRQYFHELDDERVAQLMSLNVDSTTWMTRTVLPGMLARKRGAIVNVGSGAGVSVSPLLAQYGAAKSYVSKVRALFVLPHGSAACFPPSLHGVT